MFSDFGVSGAFFLFVVAKGNGMEHDTLNHRLELEIYQTKGLGRGAYRGRDMDLSFVYNTNARFADVIAIRNLT